MSYKNTLNLPKTDFSMKANLPQNEPKWLSLWKESKIYELIQERNKDKPHYILHDGPPYANGDIHMGHVLNKTLKDIVIKYKSMKGLRTPYVPGWDCHGLPVEHQLLKEMGISKHEIDLVDFRKKAHNYAMNYVGIQREQFKRLGIFADWKNPYLTLSRDYEEAIVSSFADLVKEGYIYRKSMPVNWCYSCETALAEAEVEYDNHTSPSTYVRFTLKSDLPKSLESLSNKKINFVIWTTTPWTLVANVAIAIHPELEYLFLEQKDGSVDVILKDLKEKVSENIPEGFITEKVLLSVKGRDLEGLIARHPFIERDSRLVLADYVSTEDGTGLVHTAPGHGQEDYQTGLKYGLDTIMPVDVQGNFDDTAGEFKGLNVHQANSLIVKKLKSLGALINKEDDSLTHSYPHCWRCKKPIIFRSTAQWFLKIDHEGLRKKLLKEIDNVQWVPAIGKERISSMIELRPDWCLSRQRYWGVPIAAVQCKSCQEVVLDNKILENFVEVIKKEGTDSWFAKDLKEFLPGGFKCPSCGKDEFEKGNDILDVWFDSGVSWAAVLKKRPQLAFPSNMYLEGSDQHRGWFQSSLIPSFALENQAPYKEVLTHGFVVDGEGRKMSKSLGNVISPHEIIKDFGADILRLWVASCDYSGDVRISDEILKRLSEAYRKIRNTARYLLGNLFDYEPDSKLKIKELLEIDQWAVSKLNKTIAEVTAAFEKFEFYRAYQLIYKFCIVDMSSFYLDILKDRLYTYSAKSRERLSAQTVLYEILFNLTRMIAPILSFTAEEIWQNKFAGFTKSVHLADWPKADEGFINEELENRWMKIFEVRDKVLKLIEEKRSAGVVGSSLEAKVKIYTTDQGLYALLDSLIEELPFVFIVSQVELGALEDKIEVKKADGEKCPRCWNYFKKEASANEICSRCKKAIAKI